MQFYEIDDLPPDEQLPKDRPRWRRFRNSLFALVMITIMLGGALYPTRALLPWLLGYWREDYRVSITGLYNGDCNQNLGRAGLIEPGERLCICGLLEAQNNRAHFQIQIREPNTGRIIGRAKVYNQASGRFCHDMPLEESLQIGIYNLSVRPRLSDQILSQQAFQVQDLRPNATVPPLLGHFI